MKASVLRPYMEKFLQEFLGSDEPIEPDDNGEYVFRNGSAGIVVSIQEGDEASVAVRSILVRDVKKSQRLLDALNEINATYRFVKAYWNDDVVVLQVDLLADSLDDEQMTMACSIVSSLADESDTSLKKKFGGKLAFKDDQTERDEVKV